ncbi:MAG: single-stranded DNA-binding protein [Planctomycetes bacterium]|nr:single-stranded DNA-binding protein [Planctomycetota bacterium]
MITLNKVFLVGNLARDPDLRHTPSGTLVTEFRLAVSDSYTTSSGEKHDRTCFIDVVSWRKLAESCAEYLKKGSPVSSRDAWSRTPGPPVTASAARASGWSRTACSSSAAKSNAARQAGTSASWRRVATPSTMRTSVRKTTCPSRPVATRTPRMTRTSVTTSRLIEPNPRGSPRKGTRSWETSESTRAS